MTYIYIVAAFWFLSALVSTIIANRLKISNALMEIIVGAVIGFVAFKAGSADKLALNAVIPTLSANRFFLPDHLLEKPILDDQLPDIPKTKK